MKVQINEGPVDRLIRLVLGIGATAVVVAGWVSAPLLYVFVLVAAIGLISGVTGFCPTYELFGINTRATAHR